MTLKLGQTAPDFEAQTTTTDLFADIDRMDAHAFASHLSEGCRLRFGNAEPVAGRSAIEAAISCFFSTITGLSHHILNQWDLGDETTIIESDVTYARLDERHVTVPVVTIYRRGDELIDDYRIFIDLAPVLA
jgi:SnoaL-like domain